MSKKTIERAQRAEKDRAKEARKAVEKAEKAEKDTAKKARKTQEKAERDEKGRAKEARKVQDKADRVEKDKVESTRKTQDKAERVEKDRIFQEFLSSASKSKGCCEPCCYHVRTNNGEYQPCEKGHEDSGPYKEICADCSESRYRPKNEFQF